MDRRMPFKLTVQQYTHDLACEEDETILEAATRMGHDFPHDCRSGVCGECKCALISGQVEMKPYLDVALDEEERLQGFILGCRSVPKSDCEVALLDRDEPIQTAYQEVRATVESVEQVTHDIVIVRMRSSDQPPFKFAAGQYAEVEFEGLPARSYSFANEPGAETLEFHIRAVPGGEVSPHVYSKVTVGDRVVVRGPRGMAYLRKQHSGPVVFCAGGSGLAPIMSMIRSMHRDAVKSSAHIFFGVRSDEDVYLEKELSLLSDAIAQSTPQIVLSAAHDTTQRRTGFLADAIRRDIPSCVGMKAYLCGPPVMIETCRSTLLDLGLKREDCHADVFWTPTA